MPSRSDLGRPIGLGLVLTCLAGTLTLGIAIKATCASGDWSDGRQYRQYCYSDIVPLLGTEQLTGGRLPYLDACTASSGQCDEYPVLSMYSMRLAAWVSNTLVGALHTSPTAAFFYANGFLLAVAALIIALCLYLMVGARALYFALAPTLLIYGFMNWDLLAVAFATAGTLAYLNRRDVSSGALLGLGAAAKLYPGFLLVPFVLGRFHEKEPDRGIHIAWAGAGAWLVVNLPFAIAAPGGWWNFFAFNRDRPADWDSLWFVACSRITGNTYCGHTGAVNLASLVLFIALAVAVWHARSAVRSDFPRWTFGFPLLILFLLTNKVYSPQYSLWLLPWFALVLPDLRAFVAFEAADVAVFLTRFSWFGRYGGTGGWPIGAFEIAVLIRAVILVWCLVAWISSRRPEPAWSHPQLASSTRPEASAAPEAPV